MLLSVIIPAFNEEKELPACLGSVALAVAACQLETELEVIVCDNNSTDRTAELARKHGARVVFEPVNQISRARNAGAAAATGLWFLFIDADSRLDAENLARVAEFARSGAPVVGGGCVIGLNHAPWWVAPGLLGWNFYSQTAGRAAGSFVFCGGNDFRAVGGFNEELFAAEELDFSLKLKSYGRQDGRRFVILRGHPHLSSGRKFHLYTPSQLLRQLTRLLVDSRRIIRSRDDLGFFYDGRR
jgi:glycosyltransferase involved in cell wall biosynthesis